MRNLKRALSLALASVMLLGMMVVGSSAAFADADKIVNEKAVGIAAGLGLFAGTTEGNFDPEGTVTRAQMAAVIAKMFYGSDLNADAYKGGNQFSDTASFEGGWAEGYINLGVEKGWFKGYGDGTFGPGNAVTTAEAMTMLINLLGIDAGAGTWPMTVMAAAEENELFDDYVELKPAPATNAPMTRDQLSVVVVNALHYSAEGVQGYKVGESDILFKTWADAAAFADKAITDDEGDPAWTTSDIKEVKNDTLWETVFEVKEAKGYVTSNQATNPDQDYTVVNGVWLDLETGADMIGHYVTAYYAKAWASEKDPGVAYGIVEEAEYVKVAEALSGTADKKDFLAAFGSKVETKDNVVFSDTGVQGEGDLGYNAETYTAAAGTYVIDAEDGKIIAFINNIAASVAVVNRVSTVAGKEYIKLGSDAPLQNNADEDEVVEYDGIAEDDIVIVKTYAGGMTYLEKPEVVNGKITKKATKDAVDYVYIDGTAYPCFASFAGNTEFDSYEFDSYTASSTTTYDVYLYAGKVIGMNVASSTANLNDVIYVIDSYSVTADGAYGSNTTSYYAQGVSAEGKEVSTLIGIDGVYEGEEDTVVRALAPGFYTFEKVRDDREQAKKDIMEATPALTEGDFNEKVDQFFAVTDNVAPQTGTALTKQDKYLNSDDGLLFLTADTKFVVVKENETADELEIATYTGSIAKDVTSSTIAVAATKDANGNILASIVVVVSADLNLKAEDYIYLVDGSDYSVTEDGYEYNVYFTETDEFKTIISDTYYETGVYGNYTIDEDGIYELGLAEVENTYVALEEKLTNIFNTSITTDDEIALLDAADAKIIDVRSEDTLEVSEVGAIETLKDLASALKGEYDVFFNALIEEDGADYVVTHIFVYSVKGYDAEENYDEI